MTIMNAIFSDKADQPADKTLAFNAMAAAATGATAYLAATMQSTTPELRAMLTDITNQKITEHAAITAFMINKGWMNPYDQPTQQLEISKKDAESYLS
ncbi:MAG: spore coat protein [Eubacteriales bacterium]